MKIRQRLLSIIFILVALLSATAQILDPVSWEPSITKLSDDTYALDMTATIESGWHVYSQFVEGEEGPLPTEFTLEAEGIELVKGFIEPEGVEKFDKTFAMDIKYFENTAVFRQVFKTLSNFKAPLKASVLYMVCDEERCLPPEEKEFTMPLNSSAVIDASVNELSSSDEQLTAQLKLPIQVDGDIQLSVTEKKSLWKLFFLGFLGGFIALLTPCVFPMIPLTVSFFSHSSGSHRQGIFKALLYGFFIFLAYVLVSVPFHILDSANPDILNNVSTNTWLNTLFFVVFILFAISFLGYFELTMPSKWSNAMDSKATQLGGVVGVFFMALTLTLVSFSCTGPILGSLLGGSLSNDGGAIQLTYGMAGFGLALALPFAFFALFPNLLKKLPKSGGWMTTVKVVLGFLELAFAFKFLSNADLVQHWGILKREVFIGIWILIFSGLAAYLFGLIRFPHDAPNQKIGIPRKLFGAGVIAFVLYLIPGVLPTDKPNLKLLSGFPPPTFYSLYANEEGNHQFGTHVYTNFEEGYAAAKKMNKPMLLDFTGWACVNCRKMEEQVWSVPNVKQLIDEEVVLISLYVDDRKSLSKEAQFTYSYPGTNKTKNIKTIGDKWATFQTINFLNNSQPYYVLMDTDYRLLQQPIGFTPEASEYYAWFKKGLKAHKK